MIDQINWLEPGKCERLGGSVLVRAASHTPSSGHEARAAAVVHPTSSKHTPPSPSPSVISHWGRVGGVGGGSVLGITAPIVHTIENSLR